MNVSLVAQGNEVHSGIKHIVRFSGLCADIKSDYTLFRYLGEVEQMIVESGIDYPCHAFVTDNNRSL